MKFDKIMLVVLVFSVLLVAGCQAPNDGSVPPITDDNDDEVPIATNDEGRVVFGVTDLGLDTESVTSLRVRIDKVEVHSSEKGWIKIMDSPKTIDLIQLDSENIIQLLADVKLEEGIYQQFRVVISNVIVEDSGGISNAILPSGELKFNGNLNVNADSISTFILDFKAEDSVHVAGNGKYIFAPVIQLETRQDAEVDLSESRDGKIVNINGGSVDTNIEVGMDVDGNVDVGLKIPKDKKLTIKAGGEIGIGL